MSTKKAKKPAKKSTKLAKKKVAKPAKKPSKPSRSTSIAQLVKKTQSTPTPAPEPVPDPQLSPARKRVGRPAKPRIATVHIRVSPSKDSDTMCGGSHSEIWNRSGNKPLVSVSPQNADKGTCGRCLRVHNARVRDGWV